MEWFFLFLAFGFSCLFGLTQGLLFRQENAHEPNVTRQKLQIAGVSIVSNGDRHDFLQRDMPEVVTLAVKLAETGVTLTVTLHKRPRRFHQVPLYTFRPADNRPERMEQADRSPEKDMAWYITGPHAHTQMAVCLERRHTDTRVFVHLKDDGLIVINNTMYSLESSSRIKRDLASPFSGDLTTLEEYRLTIVSDALSSMSDKRRSSPNGQTKTCTDVYVDVCVHADWDLYVKMEKSAEAVHTYIADFMNKVQIIYDRLLLSEDFHYRIHVELHKIFVETDFDTDPLRLRNSPLSQYVIKGTVYQGTLRAHDLLTEWLRHNKQHGCDHYALLSRTKPAEFKKLDKTWHAYKSDRLGLAWNTKLCSHEDGKLCSVWSDSSSKIYIIAGHELGHSFGLSHDQNTDDCAGMRGYVMDERMNPAISSDNAKWSQCSIDRLDRLVQSWLQQYPDCLSLYPTDLDNLCANHFDETCASFKSSDENRTAICEMGVRCNCVDNTTPPDRMNTVDAPPGTSCGRGMES
ncbi:A disintegrin and metalloproteinase with thrombospondin motifs 7-like isoform X2 [Littorina saxatilis]|uniref:A disintegrin and metalloproteinase with thrombospondin motifs 7-like isoform X2 n=1 Tax=Littorina saxatilis TaxID=31220 RepID=UPI0038B501ED